MDPLSFLDNVSLSQHQTASQLNNRVRFSRRPLFVPPVKRSWPDNDKPVVTVTPVTPVKHTVPSGCVPGHDLQVGFENAGTDRLYNNLSIIDENSQDLYYVRSPTHQHLKTPMVQVSACDVTSHPLESLRPTPNVCRALINNLRSTDEIPERFRGIFTFPYFNIVQSKIFDDVMYSDCSLIVCAPTGSGKTVIFELAILRLMMKFQHVSTQFKVIYMAPLKALCSERFGDWRARFEVLGLKCMELTGDTELDDLFELQTVNIVLTTPEKWDSITRRWKDNKSFLQHIKLFLVDEIHTLNDNSRGATVEAVISRMKTVQAAFNRSNNGEQSLDVTMRFLAVSATIPNVEDVAEWFGSEKTPAVYHSLDDNYRPVKLRKVVLGYENSRSTSEFKFDLFLSYKLASIIETYSNKKPTLVFCSTRKGVQQSASILVKDARYVTSAQHKDYLLKLSGSVKEAKLRDVLVFGVGYHHAGLDIQERKLIEEMFIQGQLPVLFATSTLAMGVNLPAHLVIVKSTMFYNMGMYQEYSETQVLQMIGRAGRPQFDTSATAVIMTKTENKAHYQNLLTGKQVIESSLHHNLIEHLNAEIVLQTISDISVALEWLRSTFLYIRAHKNPEHYGIPIGFNREQIEKKLQDIIVKNLNMLAADELVEMDDDYFSVKCTDSGCLMARYCVLYETMKSFRTIKGNETLEELVKILAGCKELADTKLRMNERRILNVLNKDKNRVTIRFPMEGKIKITEMKVNCLLQAQLGCLSIQDFGLTQDTNRIFRVAVRVMRCLVEFLWNKKFFLALCNAVLLMKSVYCKLWEDTKYVSRQLDGIGPALSNALVNAGLTTLKKIEESNPRDIEMAVNRNPPFGNQIISQLLGLPKYELSIEQLAHYCDNKAEISVKVVLSNVVDLGLKMTAGPSHTCVFLIGDEDNKIVFKTRLSDAFLMKSGSWMKRLEVRRALAGDELSVNFISQTWAGFDIKNRYTPYYTSNRGNHITMPKDEQNEPNLGKTHSSVSKISSSTKRTCNHRCTNKQFCGHDCCKIGVSAKPRNISSLPKEKPSNDPIKNHIYGLKHRLNALPETPNVKRIKCNNSRSANSPVDLQLFSYKPHRQPRMPNENFHFVTETKKSATMSKAPYEGMEPGLDSQNREIHGQDNAERGFSSKMYGMDHERSKEYGNFDFGEPFVSEDFQENDDFSENISPSPDPPSYLHVDLPYSNMDDQGVYEEQPLCVGNTSKLGHVIAWNSNSPKQPLQTSLCNSVVPYSSTRIENSWPSIPTEYKSISGTDSASYARGDTADAEEMYNSIFASIF